LFKREIFKNKHTIPNQPCEKLHTRKGRRIRERYEATAKGYDELYRAEQYEKFSVALKRVNPRGLVLDAGCGTGLLAEYMRVSGYLDNIDGYYCLDYSHNMLKIAKWRLTHICPIKCYVIEGNVMHLPFPDNIFDVTYSFTVLDLVDNLDIAVNELLRVTRGPVVASFLKRLPYKDRIIIMGKPILAITSKDVIFQLK